MEMPLTPEIVKDKVDSLKSSETIIPKDASSRRSSIGVSGISSSGEKTLPNYLRASTGSCHDLCKYGKRHAFEVKERLPILKGKKSTLIEEQLPSKSLSPRIRKKKPAVELTSPLVPEAQSSDTPKHGKQHASEVKGKKSTLIEDQLPSKSLSPRLRKKKPAVELTSPLVPEAQSSDKPRHGKQHASEVKDKHLIPKEKVTTSSECQSPIKSASSQIRKKKPAVKATSHDPGTQSCDKPEFNKQETKIVKQKASSPAKNLNAAISSISSRPKQFTGFALNPTRDRILRRDGDAKTSKNSSTSIIVQKNDPVPQKTASHPTPPFNRTSREMQKNPVLKDASPRKSENVAEKEQSIQPFEENVSVKTLYVIEPKPGSKSLAPTPIEDEHLASLSSPSTSSFSPPSSMLHTGGGYIESELDETENDSEYDETDSDSEYDETEGHSQFEASKEEYKRRPRRGVATVHPEDNDPGHKLTFRRGKVIELQSENNTPRRLRFRKGRILGGVQNSASKRKSFKKREAIDGDTGKVESEKVVLRHQDVNGKKDGQVLFNNVIEETANKLVETRKSKVKALVGAFETVISLQETRPLSSSG